MTWDRHEGPLAHPPIEYRPEVRWWLAEGLHTDATLRGEVDAAHRLGFGGMEFLAMDEANIDHSLYGWGSEEWVHDSQLVVEETTRRRMAVSFTSGTNWANANLPSIDPDHPAASKELDVVWEDLPGHTGRDGAIPQVDLHAARPGAEAPNDRVPPTVQELIAVVAAPVISERPNGAVMSADETIVLTPLVAAGTLRWVAPDERTWRVSYFWMHGTGQTASPSATVNYTVNYLDPDGAAAVIAYWDSVILTPELRAQISQNPRAQMYMDSLEMFTWGQGGMFWGRTVIDEFTRRRGYDITPWLPFLTRIVTHFAASTVYRNEPDEAHRVEVEKVRFDYVRTLTDLYIENMLRPFRAFLHDNGMTLRAEISYGMPFEISRPGTEVDGVENESLEFAAQIDAYRMLGGVAHLFGKQYSSETGATSRNHMLDHRFYDQIIATQLAAGITKTVLHGWASMAGAEGTEWPGHEGMYSVFSERFDLRQPAAQFYPLWNDAIGRLQYVLRQGHPRIDVGILRTDHFIDNLSGLSLQGEDGTRVADEDMYGRHWMRDRNNHWWQDLGMQDAGWTYEFFDGTLLLEDTVQFDHGLVQPSGPGYQALIVYQETLDPDVAQCLLDWARHGLRILLVDGARELLQLSTHTYRTHERAAVQTPGLDGRDTELRRTIELLLALPTVNRISSPECTIHALRELGVTGRAEFTHPNPHILSHLREDDELLHLFAYNFLYETGEHTDVVFSLPGTGAVSRINHWTGQTHPHQGVRTVDDRTLVTVRLAPGEVILISMDRAAKATPSAPPSPQRVVELTAWRLVVDSWDDGGTTLLVENRGLGYETRESMPHTAIHTIDAGPVELAPWAEIPHLGPDISGIGTYTTEFHLTGDPDPTARYQLHLGSTGGALGAVTINDNEPVGFDTSNPVIDVTGRLQSGRNTLSVEVASSLNNRLKARGYYTHLPDVMSAPVDGVPATHVVPVRNYGLLGPVRLSKVDSPPSTVNAAVRQRPANEERPGGNQ